MNVIPMRKQKLSEINHFSDKSILFLFKSYLILDKSTRLNPRLAQDHSTGAFSEKSKFYTSE